MIGKTGIVLRLHRVSMADWQVQYSMNILDTVMQKQSATDRLLIIHFLIQESISIKKIMMSVSWSVTKLGRNGRYRPLWHLVLRIQQIRL